MKYLEDTRLTQLTSDLSGAFLNTRGSGNGSRSASLNFGRGRNGGRGRGKRQHAKSGGGRGKRSQASTMPPYFAYNPEGYGTSGSSGSCRVIFGRVEAYTTKRAGSDKKTAFEVGERYAEEMQRLNAAVEEMKRRHRERGSGNSADCEATTGDGGEAGKEAKEKNRRPRSRSVDGVTFSTVASPTMVYDKSENTAAMADQARLSDIDEKKESIPSHPKRDLPVEGILKPSSNKRCRATSFDVSTGPSTVARRYHHSESSSSLLAEQTWGDSYAMGHTLSDGFSANEDRNTRPLIPQPSLYQSTLQSSGGKSAGGPTMVPRRLVTDLILTLNASFPDYDFSSASTADFCTLSISEAMRRINEKLGEFAATTDEGRDFLPRFWNSLDDLLFGLKDCEVYSYAPKGTGEDDPLEFLTMSMATNESERASESGSDGIVGQKDVVFDPQDGRIVSANMLAGRDDSLGLILPNRISAASSDPPHVTIWNMNYFFVSRNKKRIVLLACVQTMRTPQGDEDDEGSDDYEYAENEVVFEEARRGVRESQRGDGGVSSPMPGGGKVELSSPGVGEETASVVVEEIDFDDCYDIDVDEDADPDQGDHFDSEAPGMSVGIPSNIV
ncbi:hypothetical protein ACHAXT_001477 [Thalassiosira profunda]